MESKSLRLRQAYTVGVSHKLKSLEPEENEQEVGRC